MSTLVSCIITTHNREWIVLKRAIDSVFSQTYKNLEIIVVNDSPNFEGNDEIKKQLDEYPYSSIRYLFNNSVPGACGSRNLGIKQSRGEVIALLDDDDEWLPNKIEVMLPFLNKKVCFVYCDFDFIQSGMIVKRKKLKEIEGNVYKELLYHNFVGGCSIPIISKQCFDNIGLFDESLPSAQDLDMWLRISKYYDIRYVNEKLVHYHISEQSITTDYKKRIAGYDLFLQKYQSVFFVEKEAKEVWMNRIVQLLLENGCFSDGLRKYNENYQRIDRIRNIKVILKYMTKYFLKKYNLIKTT